MNNEAIWYPEKLNPHPLGSYPERTETESVEQRRERDKADAKKIKALEKEESRQFIALAAITELLRQEPCHPARNVKRVQILNKLVEIKEQREALFREQVSE